MTIDHSAILQLQRISHQFMLHQVLDQVSVSLSQRETLAIVGPSGCGKTTLLRIMAGLLKPQSGQRSVSFQRLAMVFQQARLLPWFTARKNILLVVTAGSKAENDEKAEVLAAAVGLSKDDLELYPSELSGGMQSRVALARAFIMEPDLLLLDEPFASLDVGIKQELYRMLLKLVHLSDTSVVLITHDLMEAVTLADRILVMAADPGHIVHEAQVDRSRFQEVASASERDAQIFALTASLLSHDEVRLAFGLPL